MQETAVVRAVAFLTKKRTYHSILLIACVCVLAGCRSQTAGKMELVGEPVSWGSNTDTPVFAHYFNWFKTPANRGSWHNWEWQGNGPKHNPARILSNGQRDIASVYYPLIEPYDSADMSVVRYHMLTALAAKIDGFFIDWYGMPSDEDKLFGPLLEMAEQYGFKMCICFEDKAMFGYNYSVRYRYEAVSNAIQNMNYLLEQYAVSPAYLHIDGVPVVINFNWQEPMDSVRPHAHGFSSQEWKEILTEVRKKHAVYFVHDYHCHIKEEYWDVCDNVYPWLSVSGECLDEFYNQANSNKAEGKIDFISTLVHPGFDNTGVWGWGEGPVIIPREDGAFYGRSWERALNNNVRFLQIATWNDFGEGATIEPAKEYGNQYLEITEAYAARLKNLPSDDGRYLEFPLEIYRTGEAIKELRMEDGDLFNQLQNDLDFVAHLFAAGWVDQAVIRLQQAKDRMAQFHVKIAPQTH